ncbi:MAG: hypothetical protein Q9210_001822, partial [Variospora velana]
FLLSLVSDTRKLKVSLRPYKLDAHFQRSLPNEVMRKLKSRLAGIDKPLGLNNHVFAQTKAIERYVFSDRRSKNKWEVRVTMHLKKDPQPSGLTFQKEILRHANVVFGTAGSAGHRAAMLVHALFGGNAVLRRLG